MRIAYFSPLNPQCSGISDYSEDLLPRLAEHVDVDLFVDGFEPANPAIRARFAVYDVSEYPGLQLAGRYTLALYHMGNSSYHEPIYRTLIRFPGVTVLHEFVLHHFVNQITQHRGRPAGFIREMAYAHGRTGVAIARAHVRTAAAYPALDYPLNRRVLDASLLVLVHSRYVADLIRAIAPATPVIVIPPPAPTTMMVDRDIARARLGLPKEAFIVGSFGLATPEKRYHVVLAALKHLIANRPETRYVVVGEVPAWHRLGDVVASLGLADHVDLVGRVDLPTLGLYLSAVDVCVNLRYPTMGESSASLLRILAAGKPAIISDVGALAEIPDAVCQKVPVGEGEEDALLAALVELADDAGRCEQLGRAAQAYARTHHNLDVTVRAYLAALGSAVLDPEQRWRSVRADGTCR